MNYKILAICGSIRKNSYNKMLLNAAVEEAGKTFSIEIADIGAIPLYNQDLETNNTPESLRILREKITLADGLLIATPEYNYSIPGVLKNVLDWASRPPSDSPLNGKPLAIMGGSSGTGGTIRAQLHLRQVALSLNMLDMKKPELLVSRIQEKFDSEGRLMDENLRSYLKKFLQSFENWISILKK